MPRFKNLILSCALIASLAVSAAAGEIEAVLFTKGGGVTQFSPTPLFKQALLDFIASGSATIDVAIFNLRDADVIAALNAAHTAGKTVRVVTDGDNNTTGHPIKTLDAGITVIADGADPSIMHHKFVILDANGANPRLWMGSANFTTPSFSAQNNNALIIRDTDVAQAYLTEFDRLFVSRAFHQPKSLSSNLFTMDDGTVLEVRFSPGMGLQQRYADLVTAAASSFYFAVFTFGSSTISDAMIAKKPLDHFGWMERHQFLARFEDLVAAGMNVEQDDNPVEMHHKFLVIDKKIVATGSYNFTVQGDDRNDENAIIIQNNEGIAQTYIQEINRIADKNLEGLGVNDPEDTTALPSTGTGTTTTTTPAASASGRVTTGPNPYFPTSGNLKFIATDAGIIQKVEIYDVTGRRVFGADVPGSKTEFTWNGRNTQNELIGSGGYFFRIKSGGLFFTGSFTVIR